jgi:hypothetical protein
VLVPVTYLEKEDEGTDFTVNRDADESQTIFYKWNTRLSPRSTHPKHLDTAVLTKHNICTGSDNYRTVGLTNVAGCCDKGLSCAVCEDRHLGVVIIMTHEIGHLLVSSHESEYDHPGDNYCIHVMASWSQVSPANRSICSKTFIAKFFKEDLGTCPLDDPQNHYLKPSQMYPGAFGNFV